MKKLFTILLILIAEVIYGQSDNPPSYIWYKYIYGNRIDRGWFDKAVHVPRDTIYTKSGLAIKGSSLYYGDSTKWYAVATGTVMDTSNHWVNKIVKNAGGDSIIYYVGTTRFAVYDPAGSGSGITALTGDGTASGSGSVPFTLATVNSNVGSFTYGSFTVNAKGLITAASNGSPPVLVSDSAAMLAAYVRSSRLISTGYGLTGGGNLTADRTHVFDSATVFPQLRATLTHPVTGAESGTQIVSGNVRLGGNPLLANTSINGQNLRTLTLDSLTTFTVNLTNTTGTMRIKPLNQPTGGISYLPNNPYTGVFILDQQGLNETGFHYIGKDYGVVNNQVTNTITPTEAAAEGHAYSEAMAGYRIKLRYGGQTGNFLLGTKGNLYGDSTFNIQTDSTRGMILQANDSGFIRFSGHFAYGVFDYGGFAAQTGYFGLGTITPDSMHTVQQGIWGKRGVRFSGLQSGAGTKAVRIDAAGNLTIADTTVGGGGSSGTVNSGTQYRIAYYATTGTAISEAAAITAARALISDANGVPTHSTTTTTQLQYLNAATGTTGTTSTNLVFSTSPTLVTPVLGVATATSINKVIITAPTTSATLTLVTGSSLITAGAFATTLTSTATTNVTLPTTGTLATLAGTETFTNKTLTNPQINGAKLETSSTVGYVWTATNTAGAGGWAAATGSSGLGSFYYDSTLREINDSTLGGDTTRFRGKLATYHLVDSLFDLVSGSSLTAGYGISLPSTAIIADTTILVNKAGAQVISGVKNFTVAPQLSSLTATSILGLDGSKNIKSVALSGLTYDGTTLTATGGSGLFPLTGTGTATGNVTGDLSGNILSIINGSVGIGTPIPGGTGSGVMQLDVHKDGADVYSAVSVSSDDPTEKASLYLLKTRGTYASPTAVLSGDQIGSIRFAGQQSSTPGSYTTSASIRAIAAEDFTGIASGTDLVFYTTPIGSTTLVENMRIDNSGNIGFGTPTPTHQLTVNGSVRINAISNVSTPDSVLYIEDGIIKAGAQISTPTWDQTLAVENGSRLTTDRTIWGKPFILAFDTLKQFTVRTYGTEPNSGHPYKLENRFYMGPDANDGIGMTSGFFDSTDKTNTLVTASLIANANGASLLSIRQLDNHSIQIALNPDSLILFGIKLSSHANDSMLVRSSSGKMGVRVIPSGGGSTPTWQQTLTAGSTLTGNNQVVLANNTLHFSGNQASFKFNDAGNGSISLAADTITMNAAGGAGSGLLITNLANTAAQDRLIGQVASNGKIGYISIGSGLSLAAGVLTATGGGSGTVTSVSFTGGLISVANPTTTPAFTVAGTSGGIPYFSSASTWASSAALAADALVIGGGAGAAPATTTTGTGILTFLGTPSSANLAAALTNETGSSLAVFSVSATMDMLNVTTTSGTALTSGGGITPAANANGFITQLGGGITEAGSGTHGILAGTAVLTPVITGAAGAVTSATGLYVSSDANASGANNSAIWAIGTLRLGLAGTTSGVIKIEGSTSGIASIVVPVAAGTPTLTLPTVTGTIVQFAEASTASSATPTPTGDARVNWLYVTAQAAAAAFGAPSGTAANGNQIVIRITDNGTARALTYNSIYRASSDLALPSTTIVNKTLYLGFVYNSTAVKWDLVSVLNNF